jgi:hypothetical protein
MTKERTDLFWLAALSFLPTDDVRVPSNVSFGAISCLVSKMCSKFLLVAFWMVTAVAPGHAFEGESIVTETLRGDRAVLGQCYVTGDVRSSSREAVMDVEEATLIGASWTVGGTAWRQGKLQRIPPVDATILTNICKLFDVGFIEQFGADSSSSFEAQTEMYLRFTARESQDGTLYQYSFTMDASGSIRQSVGPAMSYSADPAIRSANVCRKSNRTSGLGPAPVGNLHGVFNRAPDDPNRATIRGGLFSIDIRQNTDFFREIGGNAHYGGELVAWDNSWLLCVRSHSPHFIWHDASKPFLRIFPVEESLGDDGDYQQFRIESLWSLTDGGSGPVVFGLMNDLWQVDRP